MRKIWYWKQIFPFIFVPWLPYTTVTLPPPPSRRLHAHLLLIPDTMRACGKLYPKSQTRQAIKILTKLTEKEKRNTTAVVTPTTTYHIYCIWSLVCQKYNMSLIPYLRHDNKKFKIFIFILFYNSHVVS